MSGTVSTRWYFSDWMSDPNVRACSLAARGLWMDMICIASANKGREHGFVMIAGRILGAKEISRHVGATQEQVETLLEELDSNGVFSKDRRGVIYCRRMVRAEKNRSNGRLGGNPNLLKEKENQESVGLKPKAHIPVPEPELFPVGPQAAFEEQVPKLPVYTDSKHELWGEGVPILIGLGLPEKRARQMIGMWLGQQRDDAQKVLAVIQRARDNRVFGPIEWITKALNGGQNAKAGRGGEQSLGGFGGLAARLEREKAIRDAADPAHGKDAADR
jgi:hypothetical protein